MGRCQRQNRSNSLNRSKSRFRKNSNCERLLVLPPISRQPGKIRPQSCTTQPKKARTSSSTACFVLNCKDGFYECHFALKTPLVCTQRSEPRALGALLGLLCIFVMNTHMASPTVRHTFSRLAVGLTLEDLVQAAGLTHGGCQTLRTKAETVYGTICNQ